MMTRNISKHWIKRKNVRHENAYNVFNDHEQVPQTVADGRGLMTVITSMN